MDIVDETTCTTLEGACVSDASHFRAESIGCEFHAGTIDRIAMLLADLEQAHASLLSKGYGRSWMTILELVNLVPEMRVHYRIGPSLDDSRTGKYPLKG
ncbi:hypothetical protein ACHAC9_23235 [Massilia sp. CMS3.1]|uniref:hypothetical protein n=1 Tax=Massilia sp. CMS3.1 TaxID=3373083 RepID=UPI003EE4D157